MYLPTLRNHRDQTDQGSRQEGMRGRGNARGPAQSIVGMWGSWAWAEKPEKLHLGNK